VNNKTKKAIPEQALRNQVRELEAWYAEQQARQHAEHVRAEDERKRWEKAAPEIKKAVAEGRRAASITGGAGEEEGRHGERQEVMSAALSPAAIEALALFEDETRVESIDVEAAPRAELLQLGLVRETTLAGTRWLVLTAQGRAQASAPRIAHAQVAGDEVDWLDEVPEARGGRKLTAEPTFLRERPGKWASVSLYDSKSGAQSQKTRLLTRFGPLGYTFVVRTVDGEHRLYGSWSPPKS